MTHNKAHFSIKRTKEAIKQEFYIPKLTIKIENANCVFINKKTDKPEDFLNPLTKGDAPLLRSFEKLEIYLAVFH